MKKYLSNKCLDFEQMLPDFFKENLSLVEKKFFNNHLKNCSMCQQKYFVMRKIYQNFKRVEEKNSVVTCTLKQLTINEYKVLNENINAYIDKQLPMDLNLMIKKFLIKNEFAKNNFVKINRLICLLQQEFSQYSEEIKYKEIIRNIYFNLKGLNNERFKN